MCIKSNLVFDFSTKSDNIHMKEWPASTQSLSKMCRLGILYWAHRDGDHESNPHGWGKSLGVYCLGPPILDLIEQMLVHKKWFILECVTAESRVYLLCALSTLVIRVFSTPRIQCKVKIQLPAEKTVYSMPVTTSSTNSTTVLDAHASRGSFNVNAETCILLLPSQEYMLRNLAMRLSKLTWVRGGRESRLLAVCSKFLVIRVFPTPRIPLKHTCMRVFNSVTRRGE